MNLILNASDSLSAKGGVITVTTSVGRARGNAIFTSSTDPQVGNFVVLEVSDTGSGISKENQSRIFDPLFYNEDGRPRPGPRTRSGGRTCS
jgi:two-component system cell cycle sensor histidine kinase/response regulator CckA